MVSDQARRVLTRLAGDRPARSVDDTNPPTATDYGETIERANAALDDLEAAADFVDDGGLERLEAAVERAEGDLSERARRGRETLLVYRDFRTVARGSGNSTASTKTDDH